MIDQKMAGQILVELVKTLRVFRAAGQHGQRAIASTKVGVLQYLAHRDARLSELAQSLSLSASVISRAVDALEASQFVQRRTDDEDGRASRISITDSGRRELAERHRHIAEQFAALLTDWSPEQVTDTLRLLESLNGRLEQLAVILASDERNDISV